MSVDRQLKHVDFALPDLNICVTEYMELARKEMRSFDSVIQGDCHDLAIMKESLHLASTLFTH